VPADPDIVLGYEFVGEIVGHGPGCTEQFPVGTRVTSVPIRLLQSGVDAARIIAQHPEALGSFGAHIAVDPAEKSPFDVWRELRAERGLWGPLVVFECVGAAGLIQQIVQSADMGTRIYCAGGWYTGDSLSITDATRQGVTIQFGGGPHPQDWYGTLDAIASGRLDPLPSVGAIVSLDEVPDALELARKSDGPPRIVVHPNGDVK
jgi:threonine dehydrogenase-like Zn-dependent dehydrogenase